MAGIFPQKIQEERNRASSFSALVCPARRDFARTVTFKKAPGATKTDVAVHVRRRIVQIQRKRAGVGAIVPIAAALKSRHRYFARRRPPPARQITVSFGDYASSKADNFTNRDI